MNVNFSFVGEGGYESSIVCHTICAFTLVLGRILKRTKNQNFKQKQMQIFWNEYRKKKDSLSAIFSNPSEFVAVYNWFVHSLSRRKEEPSEMMNIITYIDTNVKIVSTFFHRKWEMLKVLLFEFRYSFVFFHFADIHK